MNKYWFMISWKYKSGKSYVFIFVYPYEKDIGCPGRIDLTLREKFPYSESFWSAFSHIWTEYGEIQSISLSSVQMRTYFTQFHLMFQLYIAIPYAGDKH